MWGNFSDLYSKYQEGQNTGRITSIIKQALITNAKCESDDGSGKLKVGQKMPVRKKAKKTQKKKLPPKRKLPPCPNFDLLGSHVNMISNQMMMLSDGFDISVTNMIADNGNMTMGVQPDSYFTMRHQLSLEGPLGFLMTGGQRDYALECIAQRGRSSTLVANWTPSQRTMDGQWEQKWGSGLSSMFQFAVTSSDDPRLKMMLPNYCGKVTWQTQKHNISVGKGQQGSVYVSALHRVLPNLCLGSKLSYNLESQATGLQLAGQYKLNVKPGKLEMIEGRISAKALTAMYTHQLNKHATLCAKCDLQLKNRTATSSFFYKYLFGSEQSGSQIMGEVTSKLTCKTIFMLPFLRQFMLRVNGELNHFDYNPRMGQVPHKFGFSIMMQM